MFTRIASTPRALRKAMGLLLALLVWACVPVFAQNDDGYLGSAPPPPPEPNPLEIQAPRGKPVDITLSAYSLTSPIIRFRIKHLPKAGKLGTPRMATAVTGVVRYTPPAGYGPARDSFSYQVQSAAGVSAPAEVQINITDTDPQLITPGDVEFGQVLVGGSATRELTVQNIGGGLAEGTVQAPDPWTVAGDGNYSLPSGKKQTFTIVFAPTKRQTYTGDIAYSGNPERATDLNGEGVGPIGLPAGPIELTQSGAMRSATIEIENRTDTPQTLKITPGQRLDSATGLDVPANGTARLDVRAKGDDSELSDHLVIEGAGTKSDLQVHAAALTMDQAGTPTPTPAPMPAPGPAAQPSNPAPAPPANLAMNGVDDFPQIGLPGSTMPDTGAPMDVPPGVQFSKILIATAQDGQTLVGVDFKDAPPAKSYRLEGQVLTLDNNGRPAVKWLPLNGPSLTVKGGAIVVARLDHLMPGGHYVVRLAGLDDQGHVIEITNAAAIWTLKTGGQWPWVWIALGCGVVAAGAGGWAWRRFRGGLGNA